MKVGNLGVDELRRVESDIVRYVQSTSFPELTRILAETGSESRMKSAKKSLQKAGASLYKLNPKMNETVLVVGGQLKNAHINGEVKHTMFSALQTSRDQFNYQTSSRSGWPYGSGVRASILERKILDPKREISGAMCSKNVC